MAITVRREPDQRRIIVVVSGVIDAGAVPALRRALVKALQSGAPILIDLTEATSIHRDGLSTLVAAHRQAERTGRQLLLRTNPAQMRSLLAAFGIPPEDRCY